MRAAALVCLGAGAGLIRGDLRDVRGTDVACRSGGVLVTVRGARPRTVPVLARYHARLLAAARFAGTALVCGGTEPGRRNITNPLVTRAGRRDRPAPAGHLPAARDLAGRLSRSCWGWPRSCTRPGSAAPSGSATWSPAWSRPARPRRSGCSGPPGDDPRWRRSRRSSTPPASRRGSRRCCRPACAARQLPSAPCCWACCSRSPTAGRAHLTSVHQALTSAARGRPAAARRPRGLEGRPAPAAPTGRPSTPSAWSTAALGKDEPDGLPSPALQAACDDLLEAAIPEKSRTPAARWPWTGATWRPSPGPRRAAPATAPTPRPPGATARTTCCHDEDELFFGYYLSARDHAPRASTGPPSPSSPAA